MDTLTAHHEAGHAVASFLLGEMPDYVTIRPEGDTAGHMAYLSVESRAIARAAVYGSTQADRDRVTTWLVSTAAGPAAQALFMRRGSRLHFFDQQSWETFDGGGDYRRASNVTGDLPYANLEEAAEEAFDLLEQPEVWTAVRDVAEDLLRFKELPYEGIRDAIYYRDAIRTQTVADRLSIGQRKSEVPHPEHSGLRPISHEEAWRKIAAKSPLGALQVAGWRRAVKRGPEMERR